VRKFLLNLSMGEPFSLLQELPCLDNPIKLDPLLASALDLCVHYLINGCMFHAMRVELYWFQLFFLFLRCPIMVENMVEGGSQ
jgi:hypothetical protein